MKPEGTCRVCAGVGVSKDADPIAAVRGAVTTARQELNCEDVACAIVYATVFYEQDALLTQLRNELGDIPIVGASSQGLSLRGEAQEDGRMLGVALLAGPEVKARAACAKNFGQASYEAGLSLVEQLGDPPKDPAATPVFLWYDPITGGNVDALLRAFRENGYTHVIGGGASQPWGPPDQTFQYFGGDAFSDGIVALQIEGVEMVYEHTHGVEPLGFEMNVTKAEGNVIYEIDNRPAMEVWNEQLGDASVFEDRASWALGVKIVGGGLEHEGNITTRAIMGLRQHDNALVLQADIEQDAGLMVCHRTSGAIVDRAVQMAKRMKAQEVQDDEYALFLSFECGARPTPFLGREESVREVIVMQQVLGEEVPWLGMYAWGEIAPVKETTYFHNYTFPLVAIKA